MINKYVLLGSSVFVALGAIAVLLYEGVRGSQKSNYEVSQVHENEGNNVAHDHDNSHEFNHNHEAVTASSSLSTYINPIQPATNYDIERVRIGWQLFNDPNLSSNNQISCATCHDLNTNGAELIPVSVGVHGLGERNSLTVFNVANNVRFFWDGRSNTLQDQLDGPVHNPLEMDTNWNNITDYVQTSTKYRLAFKSKGLKADEQTIKDLLVEFQSTLMTTGAPFDKYLMGDSDALDPSALRGWEAFQKEGCIRCHQGVNVGGGMVMKFGFFGSDKTGAERNKDDRGRFEVTAEKSDINLFRVASLRNVAITPPYFHDGRTSSLSDAIKIMAQSQLGKSLDESKVTDIESFLKSLTGERPVILAELENDN